MPIRIYNSLTKQKEEFSPQKAKAVKMYCCGVTVYDRCHIGHARSLYMFEVIRRYFQYRGYQVQFVRNITDIDDKIINRAKELNKDWKEVVKENIAAYQKDLQLLNIPAADLEPRATDNIPAMIKDIEGLIKKGIAYVIDGDVYFHVRAFKDYGKLSGQSIEKMMDAQRIELDPRKKDPLDFALWKSSKEGEPSWDSPWGKGRPGWHIECSTMSRKHLHSETLDIHAGGRDLIFPHHENEIAQAEGLNGKPFAKYWMHHGLLTVNNQKMAKSLKNYITIEDAVKKYGADNLKMFFLSSHYASPIDFSEEKMTDAGKALQRFDILFWKAYNMIQKGEVPKPKEADFIRKNKENFLNAMDDDFNTARALGVLFDLINDTNKFIDQGKDSPEYLPVIRCAVDTVEDWTKNIFGLFAEHQEMNLGKEEQDLLKQRQAARKGKDFKRSDELRDLLKQKGIIVEDTSEGQVWRWA